LFDNVHSPLGKSVGASFRSRASKSFENVSEVCHWFEQVAARDSLEVRELPLTDLPEWCITEDEIYHHQGLYFSVIQVRVHASDREVADWDQPLITTRHKSDIVLVCKEENGVLNLLFRAAAQIGNADGSQLQPTVCLDNEPSEATPQSIVNLLETTKSEPRLLIEASAEGGRFYRCVNRYDIRWLPPSVDPELPREYCWLTLEQVRELVDRTELISDESRSVLSLLLTAAYGS
jgi:oxidase EvaA